MILDEKKISASIVLYKTPIPHIEILLKCLATSKIIEKLFVIDNSPSDELKNLFKLPWIEYIHSKKNLGYGAGHNFALRKVVDHFDCHLVINTDIYFDPDSLTKAIFRIRSDSEVGQLMPKVLNPDGSIQPLCKLLPTPFDLILRRFSFRFLDRCFQSRLDRYKLLFSGYNYEMNVPNLSGCFMLLKTSALKEIGFFDERFFIYAEDIDLTRRMHEKYVTLYYPSAVITHLHGRESYRSWRMFLVHCVNLCRYFSKWGWLLDRERTRINARLLESISKKN